MKIAFLFNHDASHQIAHTAPVLGELTDLDPAVQLSVLTSGELLENHVRSLLPEQVISRTEFLRLYPGRVAAALDRMLGGAIPFQRVAVLGNNLKLFEQFDALVVPETTSALLRTRFGLNGVKLIYLPHGSGDRSVGFRQVTSVFDLVLVAGEKVRDRMLSSRIIREDGHAIVGYPKFDTIDWNERTRFFADEKPVAFYNPHFDPLLSSWFDMGRDLIEGFAAQDRYNLIVAPHVMLFQRRLHASVEHRRIRIRKNIPARWFNIRNVRIDTGSPRSVDMSYTRSADIYIGDASSQIYEWIARPRPAIFLNPRGIAWRGNPNFAHWNLGEVIENLGDLPAALERAVKNPQAYAAVQKEAFENTFSITEQPSSRRAAEAILDFLARRKGGRN